MQGRRGRACAALTNSPADSPLAEPCLNTVLELVGCSAGGQAALGSAAVGPWPGDPCSSAAGRWRPFPLRGPGGHSQGLTRPGHQTLPKTSLGRSQHQARPASVFPKLCRGPAKVWSLGGWERSRPRLQALSSILEAGWAPRTRGSSLLCKAAPGGVRQGRGTRELEGLTRQPEVGLLDALLGAQQQPAAAEPQPLASCVSEGEAGLWAHQPRDSAIFPSGRERFTRPAHDHRAPQSSQSAYRVG